MGCVLFTGCCTGSVLNVLIHRFPRNMSLVSRSICPHCGQGIRPLDNLVLFSWPLLKGKCRHCKTPVSIQHIMVELLTGLIFLGTFILYFLTHQVKGMPELVNMGWLVYLLHVILLSALITSSVIDLEFYIIPLPICWFVTGAAVVSIAGAAAILGAQGPVPSVIPMATPVTGALALGSMLGLAVSLSLLATGKVKRSYEYDHATEPSTEELLASDPFEDDNQYNHRLEMCRELVFLAPIIVVAWAMVWLTQSAGPVATFWDKFMAKPGGAGALGSVWGYVVGCAIIWGVRVLGTLGFGKEAMGLGDVHLMGAVGAVIGPFLVMGSILVACLYGAGLGLILLLFRKNKPIPFGPYLSLGTFTVMLFHDWFLIKTVDFIAAWTCVMSGQV